MEKDSDIKRQLVDHLPQIRKIVSRIARDEGSVDDLTQECCARIIEKEKLWDGRIAGFPQWANTLVRNLTRDHLKKKRAIPVGDLNEQSALPEDDQFSEQHIRWVIEQFPSLPEMQRTVIRMKFFDEMKSRDIAKELGVTEQAISNHYRAAVVNLKKRARRKGLLSLLLPWNWIQFFVQSTGGVKVKTFATALVVTGVASTAAMTGHFFLTDPTADFIRETTELKASKVVGTPDAKIVKGENLIWCPTMQVAWDEVKKEVGGDIQLEGAPEEAVQLNGNSYDKDNINEKAFVAGAGFKKDGVIERLQKELQEKFKQGEDPVLNKMGENMGADDLMAYSFLYKELPFEYVFEDLSDRSFKFKGSTEVASFGIAKYDTSNKLHFALNKQLEVVDYKSPSSFIVKLRPANNRDEIILSRMTPEKTLKETIRVIMERVKSGSYNKKLDSKDSLVIPKLDFDITHNYKNLCRGLLNKGFKGYRLSKAIQNVRFRLDERGSKLKSKTILYYKSESMPRRLHFTDSFMILLKEKDKQEPYLAIWVDNPEILIKNPKYIEMPEGK